MNNPTEEKELTRLRSKIDEIDVELQSLINQRAQLVLQVSAVKIKHSKSQVEFYRQDREKTIIDNIKAHNTGPLTDNDVAHIFESIITACRNLQINSYEAGNKK